MESFQKLQKVFYRLQQVLRDSTLNVRLYWSCQSHLVKKLGCGKFPETSESLSFVIDFRKFYCFKDLTFNKHGLIGPCNKKAWKVCCRRFSETPKRFTCLRTHESFKRLNNQQACWGHIGPANHKSWKRFVAESFLIVFCYFAVWSVL